MLKYCVVTNVQFQLNQFVKGKKGRDKIAITRFYYFYFYSMMETALLQAFYIWYTLHYYVVFNLHFDSSCI